MIIASIRPNRLIGCHKRRGCVRSATLGCLHRVTNIPIENRGFQTLQLNKMTIFSIKDLRRDFSIIEGPALSQSEDIVLLCIGISWDMNLCRLQK